MKAILVLSTVLSVVNAQACVGCIKESRVCTSSPSDCCEGFECQGFNFKKRCQPKLSCLKELYACTPNATAGAIGCCDSMVCIDIGNGMGECRPPAPTEFVGTELGGGLSEDGVSDISGPFEITVDARFDDIISRDWQRVFDIGNGSPSDNVFLTQVGNTKDMACSVFRGSNERRLVAPNAIVEGETANWVCRVDPDGKGQLRKNGVILAEAQMHLPKDIVRTKKFLGRSPWNDPVLDGRIENFTYRDLTPAPFVGTELGGGLREADLPEISGPFEIAVDVRFDDLSRAWQRVFDISNGAPSDNIFLTQVGNTKDMACSVFRDREERRIVALNAIVEGETARWVCMVDSNGNGRLLKDGVLLAEARMHLPVDIVRTIKYLGRSPWNDPVFDGRIDNFNYFNYAPTNFVGTELGGGLAEADLPEISGPFEISVDVRFDDLSRNWQRIFEIGNGNPSDNVFLSQVGKTKDMACSVFRDRDERRVVAPNAIVEGETANWVCRVDPDGNGKILKNGAVLAEAQMHFPRDIVRFNKFLGHSSWNDPALDGRIENFNYIYLSSI